MGHVLAGTQGQTILTDRLVNWMAPLLADPLYGTLTLYWGGFLYYLLIGTDSAMVGTALSVLLNIAAVQGYNPIALGLI
jgi:hypothetical protein